MKEAAGPGVVFVLVGVGPQPCRFGSATGIGPGQQLGGGVTAVVDAHQAVPVTRGSHALDVEVLLLGSLEGPVDGPGCQGYQLVRIRADLPWQTSVHGVVKRHQGWVDHPSLVVIDDCSDGRGAQVERKHATPFRPASPHFAIRPAPRLPIRVALI